MATVSDKKMGVDMNSDGVIDYYMADVVSASDYYPFGMQMPNRTWSAGSYRYGFNGKENDNDAGEGIQDYGMRMYNVRLGRFLSVDPLSLSYPWYTPYQFAGNKPINCIDLDGLEPTEAVKGFVGQGPAGRGAKIGGDAVIKFTKGVIKTAVIALGMFTELAAATHDGDKFKNKEEAYPLTHGNPFYAAKQALIAPVDLAMRLRNDPTNPEIWGEAAAFLGILRLSAGKKASAPDIALGLNEPVSAGPPRSLVRFAQETNSKMHYDWETLTGFSNKSKSVDLSFGDIFHRVLDYTVKNKGTIKFDLTNLNWNEAVLDYGKSYLDAKRSTGYEINTIMGNKAYLKATEFYKDGKKVSTADAVKEYNEALKNQQQSH